MKTTCYLAAMFYCLLPTAYAGWRTGANADLKLGNRLDEGHFLNEPCHAVVDSNLKVFVSDPANNRVLRFSAAAVSNGGPAEAVFGQTTLVTTGFDGAASGMANPQQIAVDGAGNLWVVDRGHHRVLRFANASTRASTIVPDSVLGQPDALTTTAAATAAKMNWPTGIAVDGLGNLWVGDSGNHRVLLFLNAGAKATGAAADKVLGQANFTDSAVGSYANGMSEVNAVAAQVYDGTKVRLYLVDRVRSRVVRYDNALAKANGAAPDGVLGQANLTDLPQLSPTVARISGPTGLALEAPDRLWVADTGHNRILGFDGASTLPNGGAATLVLGQTNFTNTSGSSLQRLVGLSVAPDGALWAAQGEAGVASRFLNPPNATSDLAPTNRLGGEFLHEYERVLPSAMAVDPTSGKLFVLESEHHRILRYGNTAAMVDGQTPEAVLGQPNLKGILPALGATRLDSPEGLCITGTGALWVTDRGNHRVLRFKHAATLSSGAAADLVIGQNTFFDNTVHPASASSLSDPVGICVVNWQFSEAIWVVDRSNHRVLFFDDADDLVQGGAVIAASVVLGQGNFTDATSGLSASKFSFPKGVAGDALGRLWVADSVNNRVLMFNNAAGGGNGAAATRVLGQAAFNTNTSGVSATALSRPSDLAMDLSGRLWVNDQDNHRILRWDTAATAANGAAANGVLGQVSFTGSDPGCRKDRLNIPSGLAVDPTGHLFVGDYLNRRVLRFSPTPPSIIAWQKQAGAALDFSMFVSADPSSTVKVQFSVNLKDWFDVKTIPTNAVGSALTTVTGFGSGSFFRVVED